MKSPVPIGAAAPPADAPSYFNLQASWGSFLPQLGSAPFRQYLRTLVPSSLSVFRVFDHFGYGIFVGKKEAGNPRPRPGPA